MRKHFNVNTKIITYDNKSLKDIEILVSYKDEKYDFELKNNSEIDIRLKEVYIGSIDLSECVDFFAEGYSKLSMYGGTPDNPISIGSYSDKLHYKMPQTKGKFTAYNLFQANCGSTQLLAAFTSCNAFRGEFRIDKSTAEVVMCLDNCLIKAGDSLMLEQLFVGEEESAESLYSRFVACVEQNHLKFKTEKAPTGWCSWYCYGPDITISDIRENILAIKEKSIDIEYLLIDDGYQKNMGDWLIDSEKLGISMKQLCSEIIAYGMKPAIWVAPFIADGESEVFKAHPDWFVKDENGAPLSSADVSFGGWRLSPWYMLDITHPEAAEYIRNVFSIMKNDYGCNYFKLDANMWGALPYGKRYEDCTAIEAYRAGMKIICDVVGEDGFILGCNAPLWPSLGLVHGMRVSTDIARNWGSIKQVAFECFRRTYQNDHFWINDPDCIIYDNLKLSLFDPAGSENDTGTYLSNEEKRFHLSAIVASGGIKFLSDKIFNLDKDASIKIHKLLLLNISNVKFLNSDFTLATGLSDNKKVLFFFNPYDNGIQRSVDLKTNKSFYEVWTEEVISTQKNITVSLQPHSAKIYIVK